MIYILTGSIRTGKTTALLDWLKNREDVDGILCPDNESGSRYFLKLKNQESFPLEVDKNSNEEIITVGNFKFLKSSFQLASDYLISSGKENKAKYLIIDELGKLELHNKGLHEAAENLIHSYESDEKHHLILVVRQSLISEILQHYNIMSYQLIEKQDLTKLN